MPCLNFLEIFLGGVRESQRFVSLSEKTVKKNIKSQAAEKTKEATKVQAAKKFKEVAYG